MKIIWYDVGSVLGWATNASGEIIYGHHDFSTAVGRPARLHRTGIAVDGQLRGIMVDTVGFERPFARGQAATRSLWGQAAIIEASAHGHGFPVIDMDPSTVKKFATGNGHAKKPEMIAAAKRLLLEADVFAHMDANPNEHEADAICGLFYAITNCRSSNDDAQHGQEDGRGTGSHASGEGRGRKPRKSRGSAGDIGGSSAPAARAGKGKGPNGADKAGGPAAKSKRRNQNPAKKARGSRNRKSRS